MRIQIAPPGRTIYVLQCYHHLLEKFGAVIFWEKDMDTPGGWPIIRFWKRRIAKCFVHPPQRFSFSYFFLTFTKWKGYNRGR